MTAATPRRALLDTSVLIDFHAERVAAVADEVAVSAVSIGELHYGVNAAPDPLAQLHRRRRVQATLDRFEVLPFDVACAEYYGTLAARPSAGAQSTATSHGPADRCDRGPSRIGAAHA